MTWIDPYQGLPIAVQVGFFITLAMIVASLGSFALLVIQAVRARRTERLPRHSPMTPRLARDELRAPRALQDQSRYLWIFVVPALNEAVTIADSVSRLAAVTADNKAILVVNDGSDDDTGAILAGLRVPELTVLTRRAPHARTGKAAALNAAWHHIHTEILAGQRWSHWDTRDVIVTVVDADGRLSPGAARVARHFADARVGAVQSLVRIYNRRGFLTWAQNTEFAVFGQVYQSGRSPWGGANLGGNGQFTRLAALDELAGGDELPRDDDAPAGYRPSAPGPWHDRLTEDQDIGVRMIQAGWRGEQTTEVVIAQQGLNSLTALYRQRTRWAQGSWQALGLLRGTVRAPLSWRARLDQAWYLLTPLVQAWVGFSVAVSVAFAALGIAHTPRTVTLWVGFYLLTFGPGVAGVFASLQDAGRWRFVLAVLLAHPYLLYSWLIYPVVYRGLWRQLAGKRSWAKTAREQLTPADAGQQAP